MYHYRYCLVRGGYTWLCSHVTVIHSMEIPFVMTRLPTYRSFHQIRHTHVYTHLHHFESVNFFCDLLRLNRQLV